ncbi:hypothetical protein F2Q69_00007381 [Brassica cretica]|uniref:Ubiquitin-like protease family profile domain-containing protein n=1 Tax=Brassica cretica TaxID=69181 RepID=A0A8S9PGZ5_BRACR|nr:hypothetical protein F2Q69_00007381 [Brassica cretica]
MEVASESSNLMLKVMHPDGLVLPSLDLKPRPVELRRRSVTVGDHIFSDYLKPRPVELRRRSVTVGDHIFSDCQKMDLPALPQRIYTLGEEPPAHKSISYHIDDIDLFNNLRRALNDDEYEELKESKLGVFIKFKEMNFGWASRLVHYMLSFQLNIKKKYELWSLVGPQPVRFSLLEFEHLTGLNCDYIEDLENPRVEVKKEMAAFWEMMGVDVDAGPSTEHIKAAFGRCEEWSREDSMWLGYLSIFTGFIEGRKYSTATRASLARLVMDLERFENYPWGRVAFKVWAYFALPEFGANYRHPLPNRPSPLMLAYNGGKGSRFFKETSVINFVQKDFAEMFPRWDFDVEDPATENIIKEESTAETESGVKEESAVPRKKARKAASVEASKVPYAEAPAEAHSEASMSVGGMTKEQIEKCFKGIADVMRDGFGMCLKEIKLLGDRIEAVEKKVGITKKGTASNELQMTTSNTEKRGHEPGSESVNGEKAGQNGAKAGQNDPQEPSSSKDLSLVIANEPPEQSGEPSVLVLDKEVPTDSDLQKGETRRHRKRNVAMAHVRGKSERARKLAASQQTPFQRNNTAKVIIPKKRVGQGYDPFAPYDKKMSKVLTDWVKLDPYFKTPMDKKPRCPSRFYFTLRTPLEWLNDEHMDAFINVLRQRGPTSTQNLRATRATSMAWNYHADMVPTFCQSMKVWGLDVDDIYAPVNFRNEHWIAIWISIPKRHIVVWDSILTHIKAADLDVLMEPFVNMVPYLLVECAGSDEERVKHTLKPYTYERVRVGVPLYRAGDCGVWALKYIQCHALGMSFPSEFCNKNAKAIREKMVLAIFQETPEGHAKENEDNDENMRTYDEQG